MERMGTQTSPGVYQWNGRWVMFYDAIDTASGKYCLSVATSSSPATPFTDASDGSFECQVGLGGSIDPSPFVDANGQPWLIWKSNDGSSLSVSDVWAAPLAADGMTLAGAPQVVMAKDSVNHPWENTVDDPQMVLANGQVPALLHRWRLAVGGLRDRVRGLRGTNGSVHPTAGRAHPQLLRSGCRTGRRVVGQ